MSSTVGRPIRKTCRARSLKAPVVNPTRILKPKCKWDDSDNHLFFLAMAEHMRIDGDGLHLHFNYLSGKDFNTLVEEENKGTPQQVIREKLIYDNKGEGDKKSKSRSSGPKYCPELIFEQLCYFQDLCPKHSLQEIHEKLKNSRQRYCNKFLNMFERGELDAPKDNVNAKDSKTAGDASARALLRYLIDKDRQLLATKSSVTRLSTELDRWIWSMDIVHPANFHDFMLKCAKQVAVHTIVPLVKEKRSPTEESLLAFVPEEVYESVECETLTERPDKETSKRQSDSDRGSSSACPAKKSKSSNGSASTTKSRLTTRDNVARAGLRYKHMAAVGGVLSVPNALNDVKYHLYRLRTCLARIDIINTAFVADSSSVFDEFVVVRNFAGSFQEDIIERAVRASPERYMCNSVGLTDLVYSYTSGASVAGVENDTAIWLGVFQRADNQLALALFVCSSCPAGWNSYRGNDASFVASQLPDYRALRQFTGLDFWPSANTNVENIVTPGNRTEITKAMPQDGSVVICVHIFDTLTEPYLEPRIQSGILYDLIMDASILRRKMPLPPFEQLDRLGKNDTAAGSSNVVQETASVNSLSIVTTGTYPDASVAATLTASVAASVAALAAAPVDPTYDVESVALNTGYTPVSSPDHLAAGIPANMAAGTMPSVASGMYTAGMAGIFASALAVPAIGQTLNTTTPPSILPPSPPLEFVPQSQQPSKFSLPLSQIDANTPLFGGISSTFVQDTTENYIGDAFNALQYQDTDLQYRSDNQGSVYSPHQVSPPCD